MAMFICITDDNVKIRRTDECVEEGYWQVPGPDAAVVFQVAYRAGQDSKDRHGYMYRVLKAGNELSIRRNNMYADALIFAATGITRMLQEAS